MFFLLAIWCYVRWLEVGQVSDLPIDARNVFAGGSQTLPTSGISSRFYVLAVALVNCGRSAEAVAHFEAALRQKPAAADVHQNFARVLQQLGRTREAAEHFGDAERLQRTK